MLEMPTLEQVIDPVTPARFVQQYWEKQPLVVHRRDRAFYADLFTLEDLDHILSLSTVHSPYVRIVQDGRQLETPGPYPANPLQRANATEALYAAARAGATIVLQSLHESWPSLRELCRSLASEFSAAFQVNLYLTPAGSRGLRPHYDTHDVFVLQIHGAKHWQLFDQAVHLPLQGQHHHNEFVDRDDADEEFDLQPGELIYIPRGWGHVASAREDMSLHLTLGVYPLNWAMILLKAVEDIIAEKAEFRESLPIGIALEQCHKQQVVNHLDTLLDSLRGHLDAETLVNGAIRAAALVQQPSLEGQLLDLARLDDLTISTPVRRRKNIQAKLTVNGESLELMFHGKVLRFPAHVGAELEYICSSKGEFDPASLPGGLDTMSRIVLVRRLLEEGYLRLGEGRPLRPAQHG
jgi:ribosomal protein L16 Arg81 hydroxylase